MDLKKLIVIVFIIFGAFLTFSLYRTFAYDTSVVEEVPSTTDLEYTFKIGNSSIKQITVDSGETRYYDIVLGNPNNAKISYSVYYEMVSPSTKPDGFSIGYTSKSTGNSTGIVNNNGNITLNIVVTNTSSNAVTVKVGTVAGYVNGGELTLNSGLVVIPRQLASNYIMSLDDGSTGDSGSGVYKIHHDAILADSSSTGKVIEATDDYRYYGANPNNYVCLDNSSNSCEDKYLYRIIGSMREDSDGIYKVKIIKATPLTDGTTSSFAWDCPGTSLNTKLMAVPDKGACYGYSNNWGNSTIKYLLNFLWINGQSDTYYDGGNNSFEVDFKNYSFNEKSKSLINENSLFYLGGYSIDNIKTSDVYLSERGISSYSNNDLYWSGKIGLIYASDYGYASGALCANSILLKKYGNSCMERNWFDGKFNMSTISPSLSSTDVYYIFSGNLVSRGSPFADVSIPVFYLDKDVSIVSGTGTSTDPYLLTK